MSEKPKNVHIAFKINEEQLRGIRAVANYYAWGLNETARHLCLVHLPAELKKLGITYDKDGPIADADRAKLSNTAGSTGAEDFRILHESTSEAD